MAIFSESSKAENQLRGCLIKYLRRQTDARKAYDGLVKALETQNSAECREIVRKMEKQLEFPPQNGKIKKI